MVVLRVDLGSFSDAGLVRTLEHSGSRLVDGRSGLRRAAVQTWSERAVAIQPYKGPEQVTRSQPRRQLALGV